MKKHNEILRESAVHAAKVWGDLTTAEAQLELNSQNAAVRWEAEGVPAEKVRIESLGRVVAALEEDKKNAVAALTRAVAAKKRERSEMGFSADTTAAEDAAWLEVAEAEALLASAKGQREEAKARQYFPPPEGFRLRGGADGIYVGLGGYFPASLEGKLDASISAARWRRNPDGALHRVSPPRMSISAERAGLELRLVGLGLKGERGTQVPDLFFPELDLRAVVSLRISLAYAPGVGGNKGSWILDPSDPNVVFRILDLHKKQRLGGSALLQVPASVMRWAAELAVPSVLATVLPQSIPPRLGEALETAPASVLGSSRETEPVSTLSLTLGVDVAAMSASLHLLDLPMDDPTNRKIVVDAGLRKPKKHHETEATFPILHLPEVHHGSDDWDRASVNTSATRPSSALGRMAAAALDGDDRSSVASEKHQAMLSAMQRTEDREGSESTPIESRSETATPRKPHSDDTPKTLPEHDHLTPSKKLSSSDSRSKTSSTASPTVPAQRPRRSIADPPASVDGEDALPHARSDDGAAAGHRINIPESLPHSRTDPRPKVQSDIYSSLVGDGAFPAASLLGISRGQARFLVAAQCFAALEAMGRHKAALEALAALERPPLEEPAALRLVPSTRPSVSSRKRKLRGRPSLPAILRTPWDVARYAGLYLLALRDAAQSLTPDAFPSTSKSTRTLSFATSAVRQSRAPAVEVDSSDEESSVVERAARALVAEGAALPGVPMAESDEDAEWGWEMDDTEHFAAGGPRKSRAARRALRAARVLQAWEEMLNEALRARTALLLARTSPDVASAVVERAESEHVDVFRLFARALTLWARPLTVRAAARSIRACGRLRDVTDVGLGLAAALIRDQQSGILGESQRESRTTNTGGPVSVPDTARGVRRFLDPDPGEDVNDDEDAHSHPHSHLHAASNLHAAVGLSQQLRTLRTMGRHADAAFTVLGRRIGVATLGTSIWLRGGEDPVAGASITGLRLRGNAGATPATLGEAFLAENPEAALVGSGIGVVLGAMALPPADVWALCEQDTVSGAYGVHVALPRRKGAPTGLASPTLPSVPRGLPAFAVPHSALERIVSVSLRGVRLAATIDGDAMRGVMRAHELTESRRGHAKPGDALSSLGDAFVLDMVPVTAGGGAGYEGTAATLFLAPWLRPEAHMDMVKVQLHLGGLVRHAASALAVIDESAVTVARAWTGEAANGFAWRLMWALTRALGDRRLRFAGDLRASFRSDQARPPSRSRSTSNAAAEATTRGVEALPKSPGGKRKGWGFVTVSTRTTQESDGPNDSEEDDDIDIAFELTSGEASDADDDAPIVARFTGLVQSAKEELLHVWRGALEAARVAGETVVHQSD